MLGSEFKRAVHATIERVFQASGRSFSGLEVLWQSRVGVVFKKGTPLFNRRGVTVASIDATILLPNIDDAGVIPDAKLPLFIGYVIHELGHVWHTDNDPWDQWRHDPFISRIINGLEDPRIERCVIDEGSLSNARSLLEGMTNNMLRKGARDPYVDPNDLDNLAFQLAIEGRRLNGYRLAAASVVHKSIYRGELQWALAAARSAKCTADIVEIALEFAKRVRNKVPPDSQQDDQPSDQQDDQGDQPSDQPSDKPSDQQGDGEGDGEGDGDGDGNGEGEGEAQDNGRDSDSGRKKGGGEIRDIEPDGADVLADHVSAVDAGFTPRPVVLKPQTYKFNWK